METLEEYKEKIKTCSDVELEGILKRIDKEKYPDRYQVVQEELKSRRSATSLFLPDSDAPPEYAGFWRRFCASILDGLVLAIPQYLIALVAMTFLSSETKNFFYNANPGQAAIPLKNFINFIAVNFGAVAVSFLLNWLYSATMESSKDRATYGKQWLGIQVTDLKGQRISFKRASIRDFSKILSTLFFIGYLMAAFTEKKQALHDKIAGCLVIQSRS